MSDADTQSSLLGGDVALRAATSKIPPVESPMVFAPFRRPEDRAPFLEFVGRAGLQVEIGFGRGHHLRTLAQQSPSTPVLGFETKRQWCRKLARAATRLKLANARVVEGDARAFLSQLVPNESVSVFHVLFPDPWWKKKHHKRRLFSLPFLQLLHDKLSPGGHLIAKTDVPAYADFVEAQLTNFKGFELKGVNSADQILSGVPKSHREKKCRQYTIPVYSYRYEKRSS